MPIGVLSSYFAWVNLFLLYNGEILLLLCMMAKND